MEYLKYALKSLLKDRRTLIWSLSFSFFLDILIIFYLTHIGTVIDKQTISTASGIVYALIVMMSMSFASIAIGRSFVEQSRSFSHLFRFSKMNGKSYLIQLIIAVALIYFIISSIFLIITSYLFYAKYNIFVLPSNSVELLLISVIGGLTLMGFVLLTNEIVLIFQGRKNINFVQFVPVYLYFALDWAIVESGVHGSLYYLSPFLSVTYLMSYSYTGTTLFPFNTVPYHFSIVLSLISVISWIIAIIGLSSLLIEKIYLSHEEEERVI
ncbi:hypothetical protein EWF20_04975 [Sulfolobus sp. S-194]|uniref:hypothetical protein n=1 Tax=Sulfolobus sp. S-194 TaxID=2512240 RepID=UPI001437050E|nr:hypothetical protein [Sulfolobus sp. S-194]QIW23573.1 hypothetical protein EWF20_04975 [Sulfolobus sp. S-194]